MAAKEAAALRLAEERARAKESSEAAEAEAAANKDAGEAKWRRFLLLLLLLLLLLIGADFCCGCFYHWSGCCYCMLGDTHCIMLQHAVPHAELLVVGQGGS